AARARAKIALLRGKMAATLKELGVEESPTRPAETVFDVSMTNIAEIESYLASLEASLQGPMARRAELTKELERMGAIASEVSPLLEIGLPIEHSAFTFLDVHYGEIHPENVEVVKEKIAHLPAVVFSVAKRGKNDVIVLIGVKSDRLKLKKILKDAGFDEIEITAEAKKEAPGITEELLPRIGRAKEELAGLDATIASVREANETRLVEYSRLLRVAALLIRFVNHVKRTTRTYIFSGWIPVDELPVVEREVMQAARGRALVQVLDPDDVAGVREGRVKVPVLLKHPGFLRPFGLLISSYATPDYKTVDPTFFMAITFLLMFGIMFGDVGHGAVLLTLGWLVSRRAKDPGDTMALFGRLGAYCGASSIVFGFLFGSVFGVENLLPHLWMKPMDNVMYAFKVVIYYGIAVITLGIALNVFNSIRTRNFAGLFFDHAGLVVAALYWAGIVAVSVFLSNKPLPKALLFLGVGLPVIVLFLKEPLIAVARRKKVHFENGVGMYIFESFLEVMEILTGYLSNTVSFIRVAAFSLAHVGLFIAVFSLAGMVRGASGGAVYAVLIQFFGNIGIIALEGLIVTIQAIRLEYYEFFGKFFFGGGMEYKPIGLSAQTGRED
ncbi:MAG: V-type ATPase 116kDa subunit family protein, partial [Candidatus Krumholzibacteriaceae bacterium]